MAALETDTLKLVQQRFGLGICHCHMLEHESRGMMGALEVID